MYKYIPYIFIFLFYLSQLNAQGGSLGCGQVIVDQIPFSLDSTNLDGGDNVDVAQEEVTNGNGEDIVFTLNVHEEITIDISLCHSETLFDAQMGVFLLNDTCGIDSIPSSCRYPTGDLTGSTSNIDCWAEDTQACTFSAAPVPDSADIQTDQPYYRPIIYEYELAPLDGDDTTAYYIVVDGYGGLTGNFRITIQYSQAPYVVSTELNQENDWIDLTFNESVFSNEFPWDAQDEIEQNDLIIDFNQNNGNVTAVAIESISKTDGNPLEGGELSVRVNLNIENEPPISGVETIEIGPINSSTLYDGGGTSMEDTSTSGVITLNQVGESECYDQELTEEDFPFKHISDFNISGDNWDFDTFDAMENINGRDSNDYSYKLTLTEPSTIYITTCDDSTTLDVQIAIFNDCDISSWIFYQDDSNWYIVYPNGISERYPFECISGILIPNRANMLPQIELEAGDYYVVVDDRNRPPITTGTTVATMIGYSLLVDSTRIPESLNSINYYFNQEVYGGTYADVYSDDGIGLEISDFEITIESNGGNTTGAGFTSITNLLGNPLQGGEEAIRLNIGYNELPSGSEVAIIKPASLRSVFNVIGVPLLDTTGIEINLVDQLPPSLSFNPDVGEAILPTDQFTLTASEPIRLLNDSTITNIDLNNMISIAYTDGDEETIAFSASIENNVITIIPNLSLTEMRQLRITLLDSLEDLSNNQIDTYTANYSVRDISPPIINTQSDSISTSNAFFILSFSESVYTNNNGTGSLELSDFSLDFSDNGGNATDVTMVDLQRPGPSGPLLGGEDSIWIYLSIDGTPSGVETFTITTNGNEAIFDGFGNPLAFPNNSTSEIMLNPYPRLTGNSLENNNVYVELVFSEGVFSASDTSSGVEVTDFDISFNQNSGNANDAVIHSLTKINDSPLSGNESTIRVVLNISSPPPSGLETIQITPANAYAICNYDGNRLSVSECTVNLTLIDRLVPTINDVHIIADSIVTITSSEDMYNNVGATGAVSTNHFQATVYLNNGNASEATIVNITNDNQGPLVGGEKIVRIGFVTDLSPSGVEEMTISPAGPANPIYDPANNQMPQSTISARVMLPDRLPPTIISETAVIAIDNSYVEFSVTEGVYGSYEITNHPVEPNDFDIIFIQNNGNASSAIVDFITNENQFPVAGGEKILRCYLSFDATPSGHEQLYIRAFNGNSVFDMAGNSLRLDQVTDTLQLSDQLVPTVSSISIPHGSSISSSTDQPINITFSEPIQSFNYSISARHYNSLSWDTTGSSDARQFQLTLNKPMASLDTITITIKSLTDSSGLEAVDFSYEFYTPALGDYDTSGIIDIEDLTRFVTFWLADSEAIFNGLGPTTGQIPHFVPHLDHQYDLDDGMTFIRMWSWSIDKFGFEPLDVMHIGSPMDWHDFIEDIPAEAISGQLYIKYDPRKGSVDLEHTSFGPQNFTLLKNSNEKGEILLEFGLIELDDITRTISINASVDAPSEALIKYKFFDKNQKIISSGTQKIQLLIPTDYILNQNYPNPFNHRTTISYGVPNKSFINIDIFDINGRLVETLVSHEHEIGFYQQNWSGRNVASGIYFIKLTAEKRILTKKMILLK